MLQRRTFAAGLAASVVVRLAHAQPAATESNADAASGIRAALERGAASAVALLGRPNGFLSNPQVRIPLPGVLDNAARMLRFTGQQSRIEELVTAMNRAAEAAVPEAKGLLMSAVKAMRIGDARRIVSGGENSVTEFFASKTRSPLTATFLPIVESETAKVDLAARYNEVAGKVASFGILSGDDANIERYVTGKTLDGLYYMIGEEEKKIRRDPIGTGSDLLVKVFGR